MKKKKIKTQLKSTCCGVDIKVDMSPDFIGDNPKTMQVGTCCYMCSKCNQPCDVYANTRKTWNRNPATKVKGDERGKFKEKLTKKEIDKIRKNEDF
jgi:L-lactate utilization protein LutB